MDSTQFISTVSSESSWLTPEILAIIIGPITAVIITLFYQRYREKRNAKMHLFLTLVSQRKENPIPRSFVYALNQIDVVFNKDRKVIAAWKELYNSTPEKVFEYDVFNRKLLDLLDEMAKSLGYSTIKQTDFDEYYSPKIHGMQNVFTEELQKNLLRVLQNSNSFGIPKKGN